MNPFDLSGPSFLVFYWTLSVVSLLVVHWFRVLSDVTGAPSRMTADPCMLAYLRDGYPEVVRVALLGLMQDGVVVANGRVLSLAPEEARPRFQSERTAVERELISYLTTRAATVDQIVEGGVGKDACLGYQLTLEDFGYMPRSADLARARTAAVSVALVLALVALVKIIVAVSRGRSNVIFLLLSAAAAVFIAMKLGGGLRNGVTTSGRQAIDAAEALLGGARQRLKDASTALSGQELAWIAAAFGFSVFNYTESDFGFWPALAFDSGTRYRSAAAASNSGYSSSSSSSCSTFVSSCGGGGGSSCGGGGCGGGGCGGCGGGG